jgi:hypothetical protein
MMTENPADWISRDIGGLPVRHRDSDGMLHAVEWTELNEGIFLHWTLCGRDLEDGEFFTVAKDDGQELGCAECRRLVALPPQPPVRQKGPIRRINPRASSLLNDLAVNDNKRLRVVRTKR